MNTFKGVNIRTYVHCIGPKDCVGTPVLIRLAFEHVYPTDSAVELWTHSLKMPNIKETKPINKYLTILSI